MTRQDRPKRLCLRFCDRTVVIVLEQRRVWMAQVLCRSSGIVEVGEVVGSVAVAQTIVWPIPTNRLFGVDPLPLEVGNLLERSVPLLDVPNPLVEVGRERLNPAIFTVLGNFLWHEYLTLLDVVVDHIGCFPLGSQPSKHAKDGVGRQGWFFLFAVG